MISVSLNLGMHIHDLSLSKSLSLSQRKGVEGNPEHVLSVFPEGNHHVLLFQMAGDSAILL